MQSHFDLCYNNVNEQNRWGVTNRALKVLNLKPTPEPVVRTAKGGWWTIRWQQTTVFEVESMEAEAETQQTRRETVKTTKKTDEPRDSEKTKEQQKNKRKEGGKGEEMEAIPPLKVRSLRRWKGFTKKPLSFRTPRCR